MSVDLTLWSSEAWTSAADDYLLSQARGGSAEAYAELWRRNLSAAYAVAHRFRGRAAAEDVVAEASARVFGLLADGRGPEQNFRSYFLSTVKTVAIDGARRDLKLVPAADEDLEDLAPPRVEDFDADLIDGDLVRSAFRGLSERDQRLLWHTTVEGATPRAIAPELGMSPNTVSARASRARDALRARYLDAHAERGIAGADSAECRWTIERLGAHVQGRLPKRQEARVAAHLGACHHAAGLAARLRVIDESFPVLVAPLAFLAGASMPGFLAGTTTVGLTSAAATGAAVAGPIASAGHASAGSTAGAALPAGTAGSSAAAGAGATPPPPAPPGWVDTVGSITSRAAAVAVGVAIGVGLTAGPDPAPRPTAATVSPTPSQPASAVPGVIPVTPPPAAVPAPPPPSPTTPTSPPSPLSAPTVPLAPVAPSARLP
ncbi:MAG: sigma-70 family RNA polymerase sigma factor, partial [Dermatophilaceae bacterium]